MSRPARPTPVEDLLPARGQHVHLLMGEVRLDARVEAVLPGRLQLALAAAPYNVRRAADAAAQVHSSQESGICRLLGRLRMLSGHAVDGVLVEFAYAGTPQLLLRREHVRAALSSSIDVDLPTGEIVRTRTLNISTGGLLLRGPIKVRTGTRVEVYLRLPGARSATHAVARVVRVTADGHIGLSLIDISAADQARLTLAVFEERQRVSARR